MPKFDKKPLPLNNQRIMDRNEVESHPGYDLSYTQSHSHFSEQSSRHLTSNLPSVVTQYSGTKRVKKDHMNKFKSTATYTKGHKKSQFPGYLSGSSDMSCSKVKGSPLFHSSNRVCSSKETSAIQPQKVSTRQPTHDKKSFHSFGSTTKYPLQSCYSSNPVRTKYSHSRKYPPSIVGMTISVTPATPTAKARTFMGNTSFPLDYESDYDHLSSQPEDNRRISTMHTPAEMSTNLFVVDHNDKSDYDHLCDPLTSEQMEKRTVPALHTPASSFSTLKLPPVSLTLKKNPDKVSASSIVPVAASRDNVQSNKKEVPSLVFQKPLHLKYQKPQQRKTNKSTLNKGTALSHSSVQFVDESSFSSIPPYVTPQPINSNYSPEAANIGTQPPELLDKKSDLHSNSKECKIGSFTDDVVCAINNMMVSNSKKQKEEDIFSEIPNHDKDDFTFFPFPYAADRCHKNRLPNARKIRESVSVGSHAPGIMTDTNIHQPNNVLPKHQKLKPVAGNSFPLRKHIGLEGSRSRLPALWKTDLEISSIEQQPPRHLPQSRFAVKTYHNSKDNILCSKNEQLANSIITNPCSPPTRSPRGHLPDKSHGRSPCDTIISKSFTI